MSTAEVAGTPSIARWRRACRQAWAAMALLVLLAIGFAWTQRFQSQLGVDNRTYMQMVDGVRKNGWPYNLNGPSDRYPELRPRFNIPRDGKNWGEYPPVYPYFAAPFLAYGGMPLVNRVNILLVAIVGIITHLVARRVARCPRWGAAAGGLAALATPLWPGSVETLAQPLMEAFCMGALLLALETVRRRDGWTTRLLGLATGLLAGLGAESHLLGAPMALSLFAGLAWARWRRRGSFVSWAGPAAFAAFAFGLVLLPVSLLNHWRFGTYNPITYGPCVWEECVRSVGDSLTPSGLGSFGIPPAIWAFGIGISLLVSRGRPRLRAGLLVACALALVPETTMRLRVWQIARTVYGYFVDVTPMDFGVWGDGDGRWGHMWGGQLCKGLLQCSPVLALAVVLFVVRRKVPDRAFVVLAPLVGCVGSIAVLARFTQAHAFGWPHLFMRYAIPAAPYLAVLAAGVLARLAWRRWHALFFVGAVVVGLLVYAQSTDDLPLYRRVISLRVTLAVAAVAVVAAIVALRRGQRAMVRLAPPAAALAAALAVSVNVGADSAQMVRHTARIQRKYERFASLTPQRFAIVGWGVQTDEVLAITTERDIVYFDLIEGKGWRTMRWFFDRWAEEKRPVYAIFPEKKKFGWPYAEWDVPAERIDDEYDIWRIDPPKRPADEGPSP